MKALDLSPIVLLDSRNGIYNPKLLAEMIINGILKVKNKKEIIKYIGDLGNTENEYYWDSYIQLLDNIIILDEYNNEFYITENDCDLWLVPIGFDLENYFQ